MNFISDSVARDVKNLWLFPDHLSKVLSRRHLALKNNLFLAFLDCIFNCFLFFFEIESRWNLEAFSLTARIEVFVDIWRGVEEYNIYLGVARLFFLRQFLTGMGSFLKK